MYYIVKVKTEIELDSGKVKKQTDQYLVDAVSITDAEVIVTKFLVSSKSPQFEVISVSESKIYKVLSEDGEK